MAENINVVMTDDGLPTHRHAALALLNGNSRLSIKAGRFLGQIAVDPSELTDRQAEWLDYLLDRAGLLPDSDESS